MPSPSRVQGGTFVSANATSGTITLTVTAGNLLTEGHKAGATGNTLAVSDGTNTWNSIDAANTQDGGNELGSFYAANVAGGSVTVTLTSSVTGHSLRGILEEWSGVQTSSPLNDHGSNGNTGANTSGSVTTAGSTTNSGDLVVAWTTINNAETTDTPGTGYTAGSDILTGRIATEWKVATASGSQTADYSWTASAGSYMATVATFTAAGAAAHSDPPFRRSPFRFFTRSSYV